MTSAPRCRTRMSRIAHSVGVSRSSSPSPADLLGGEVDGEGRGVDDGLVGAGGVGVVRAGALGGAAHGGAHPGEEFGDAEGFGDVVVGAGVERVDLVRGVDARGQHDDGHGRLLAQGGDDRGAVDVGQSEVEDHQVGPVRAGGRGWRRGRCRRWPRCSRGRRGGSAGSAGCGRRRRRRARGSPRRLHAAAAGGRAVGGASGRPAG